jgi:hypothetical protein
MDPNLGFYDQNFTTNLWVKKINLFDQSNNFIPLKSSGTVPVPVPVSLKKVTDTNLE